MVLIYEFLTSKQITIVPGIHALPPDYPDIPVLMIINLSKKLTSNTVR